MTDYRIQTIDYKFLLHKELSGSLKSELFSYLRLLAVYVSLLAPKGQANIDVLYQILSLISSRFEKNLRDSALDP